MKKIILPTLLAGLVLTAGQTLADSTESSTDQILTTEVSSETEQELTSEEVTSETEQDLTTEETSTESLEVTTGTTSEEVEQPQTNNQNDDKDLITNLIANTLFKLAFDKAGGESLWVENGIDWMATDRADYTESYKQAIAWYNEQPKEELSLASGAVGYYLANGDSNKTVILAHGYRGSHSIMGPWAKMYYDLGYNVLTPDAQGITTGGKNYIDFGWNEKSNYVNWVNLVNEMNNQEGTILLSGVSMGAATVLMTAGEQLPENVIGVIADSAYTSLEDELNYIIENISTIIDMGSVKLQNKGGLDGLLDPEKLKEALPLVDEKVQTNLGFAMAEVSTVNQVQKATIPVGLIHNSDDTFIPQAFENTLFDNISATKYIYQSPVGNHIGGINMSYTDYVATVKNYIEFFEAGADAKLFSEPITQVVTFVDKDGNVLAEPQTFHGQPGESFEIVLPEIEGYELAGDYQTQYTFGEEQQDISIDIVYTELPEEPEESTPEESTDSSEETGDSSVEDLSSEDSSTEESTISSEETETSDSLDKGTVSSNNNNDSSLPQTGEVVGTSLAIVGSLFVFVAAFLNRKTLSKLVKK
ncbi:serine aminopeptidase domain-containing protein [Vagococcus zengguangii]|uniref:Uncharacterized protein n=1 Tax=Vagococcus zengguangii TaxID=2571750 RepID=A0A4D7CUR3_9ENTE|nr:alpha/beta hydrolase [Vagococcus zengguangii]QCI86061.1 hypothetical protein FA707_03395 [Vagococcus zengguangii]TLG80196.1 hypothetical protein FE258_05770 [Vagococcus zengguangii]